MTNVDPGPTTVSAALYPTVLPIELLWRRPETIQMGGSTRSRSATLCPGLMSTCAEVLAATLRDAGVERMFGLPGGEILDFIEAARKAGIDFIVTRHEAVAAFMADAAGQIARRPAVCVSTLGPGALNLTLGVANAFLDRPPLP